MSNFENMSETDAPDAGVCEEDNSDENSNLSSGQQVLDSEETKSTSISDREIGDSEEYEKPNIVEISESQHCIRASLEEIVVSESQCQAEDLKVQSILEPKSKFVLDTDDNAENISSVSESNLDIVTREGENRTPQTSALKRKFDSEVIDQSPASLDESQPLESPNKVPKSTPTKSDVKTVISPKMQRLDMTLQLQKADKSPARLDESHPLESPNKVLKSTPTKSDVKTVISPKMQVSQRLDVSSQLQEADSSPANLDESHLLESPNKTPESTSTKSSVKTPTSPKMQAGQRLDVSSQLQEADSRSASLDEPHPLESPNNVPESTPTKSGVETVTTPEMQAGQRVDVSPQLQEADSTTNIVTFYVDTTQNPEGVVCEELDNENSGSSDPNERDMRTIYVELEMPRGRECDEVNNESSNVSLASGSRVRQELNSEIANVPSPIVVSSTNNEDIKSDLSSDSNKTDVSSQNAESTHYSGDIESNLSSDSYKTDVSPPDVEPAHYGGDIESSSSSDSNKTDVSSVHNEIIQKPEDIECNELSKKSLKADEALDSSLRLKLDSKKTDVASPHVESTQNKGDIKCGLSSDSNQTDVASLDVEAPQSGDRDIESNLSSDSTTNAVSFYVDTTQKPEVTACDELIHESLNANITLDSSFCQESDSRITEDATQNEESIQNLECGSSFQVPEQYSTDVPIKLPNVESMQDTRDIECNSTSDLNRTDIPTVRVDERRNPEEYVREARVDESLNLHVSFDPSFRQKLSSIISDVVARHKLYAMNTEIPRPSVELIRNAQRNSSPHSNTTEISHPSVEIIRKENTKCNSSPHSNIAEVSHPSVELIRNAEDVECNSSPNSNETEVSHPSVELIRNAEDTKGNSSPHSNKTDVTSPNVKSTDCSGDTECNLSSDSNKTDVAAVYTEKIQIPENIESDSVLVESLKSGMASNLSFRRPELNSQETDVASPDNKSTQIAEDLKCEVTESGNALDLSLYHREFDSKLPNVASANASLEKNVVVVKSSEVKEESASTSPPESDAAKFESTNTNPPETKKELDLVKVYRIQKWLKGVSTFDSQGKFIPLSSSNTSKSSSSKRKLEVSDQIPGCSSSDNPLMSPKKVLKTPGKSYLDPASSKSETTEPDDGHIYTCNKCFQIFFTQQALEDHKAFCINWFVEIIPPINKQDFVGREPLKGISIDKEYSYFESTSKPREATLGEKYLTPISPSAQRLDNDWLQTFYICPECGCSLSSANLDSCYHHAVSCFFARASLPKNEFTIPDDILDSEGYNSVTHSDNSLSSEFLNNMLNFYKEQFMRATIAITDFTDDYNSSSDSECYHQCPICFKSLENQSLNNHIKKLHVKAEFSAKDAARELAADAAKHDFVRGKVFKCKKCGGKFSSLEGIRLHIDEYVNGDCCPESSHISEQNAKSDSSDKVKDSPQMSNSTERSTTTESVNQDGSSGSIQIPKPTEKITGAVSARSDSCQKLSRIVKLTEHNSDSANKHCQPGSSKVSDHNAKNDGFNSIPQSENAEGGCSEDHEDNCVVETAYTCRFCYYACENLDDMVDHYSIHELLRECYSEPALPVHESRSGHVCPDCLKQFDDLDAVIDHINLVYKRPLTCPFCHEFLTSETNYYYHFQQHTTDFLQMLQDEKQQKIDSQLTPSTEDQDDTKSTPKRRRKRSKKNVDHQKSDNHSSNTRPVDETARFNAATNETCYQSSITIETNEIEIKQEKNLEDYQYTASISSHQIMQLPEIQESGGMKETSKEVYIKQEFGEASENLNLEGHSSIAITSDQKDIRDECKESVTGPTSTQPSYPSSTQQTFMYITSGQKDIKEECVTGPISTQTSYLSSTQQTFKYITSDQKDIREESKESVIEPTSTEYSYPSSTQQTFMYITSDQKDIREESKESVRGPISNEPSYPSSTQQTFTNITSDQKDIREESREFVKEPTNTQPPYLSSTQQTFMHMISDKKDVKEESIESDMNIMESISVTASRSVPQIPSTSDQEEIIKEESKEFDMNIREPISVHTSPIAQISSPCDRELVIGEDTKSKEYGENLEAFKSEACSQSAQATHSQIASPDVSSNQKDIASKVEDSEKNSQEPIFITASSSVPQIIDFPNNQRVIFTYASSDQDDIREESKEATKESDSNRKNPSYQEDIDYSREATRESGSYKEEYMSLASSSIPQIIDFPNNQRVIFTYASSDHENIREDSKEANKSDSNREQSSDQENREDSRESDGNKEKYMSAASPPDPRFSAIKKMAAENYDADVSGGASSDDQEVVQIRPYGMYARSPKKNRTGQGSAPRFPTNDPFTCRKCNMTFDFASDFVAHNLMHSNFICLKCNQPFHLKSLFLDHLVVIHTRRKPFECPHCWRSFGTSLDLRIHSKCCTENTRNN